MTSKKIGVFFCQKTIDKVSRKIHSTFFIRLKKAMARQFCQDCGATLMATLRMCPACGSKNLEANPQQTGHKSTLTSNQTSFNISSPIANANEPKGLSGWLKLVAIGLFLGVIKYIALLISTYNEFINTDSLQDLTNINSQTYIPNFKILFYTEIVVNLFIFAMLIYLIYLFFKSKSIFPKYYIFISLFIIFAIPIDSYVAAKIVPDLEVFDSDTIKSFLQSLVSGAIWIPYMLKSKRVKNTFIED
jgi:hypothetical protein